MEIVLPSNLRFELSKKAIVDVIVEFVMDNPDARWITFKLLILQFAIDTFDKELETITVPLIV